MGYRKRRLALPTIYQRSGWKKRKGYGYLGGGIGSETKFKDSELVATAVPTVWTTLNPTTLNCLSAVAQGTTESEHLGRTMYITSIHLKGAFLRNLAEGGTTPQGDYHVRFLIVLDTDTKGVELDADDVMDIGQTADIFAFRNLQHTSRLKVLADRQYVIRPWMVNEGATNAFANSEARRTFKFNHKFKKPMRVLFSGTTAVVGSVVDNSLHFVVISSESGVGTVDYQCRLRFKDTLP